MAQPQRLERGQLRLVATRQKGILVCILAYLLLVVLQFLIPPALRPVLGLVALAVVITATVFVFLLATTIYSTGMGIVLGILTLIPLVGLVVLLVVNGKATAILKNHGCQVGLLGVRSGDL